MRRGSLALISRHELAGVFSRVSDEFAKISSGQIASRHQNDRRGGEQRDPDELIGIKRERLQMARNRQQARRCDQQCAAIGGRPEYRFGARAAAQAGDVVDNHRLHPSAREPPAHDARDCVEGTRTCRETDNQRDGARLTLRRRQVTECRRQECKCS